ncbi:MAG: hypothetical protein P8107_06310 [Spirochaetia bacterium]
MFGKLKNPEMIFDQFFLPWYEEKENIKMKIRPDMFKVVKEGTSIEEINVLSDEGIIKIRNHINTLIKACHEDWSSFLSITGEIGLNEIDLFDKYYNKRRVIELMKNAKTDDFSNEFIVTCCEFGSVIGNAMIKCNNDLCWIYDYPYWDSMIYHKNTGYMISVFSWAINKFSSYGINDGYYAKINKCLDILKEEEIKLKND